MRTNHLFSMAARSLAMVLFLVGLNSQTAQSQGAAALTGVVSSTEEGPMEGVLVSAKKAGSTVTVTVVSDAKGSYSFPRAKLVPGQYSLRIRAVGYEMDDSGPVDVAPQKAATADLKLRKAKDISSQLNSTEWILSVPGTEEQKSILGGCTACHSMERVVKSKHDAAEWENVIKRMNTYAPPSSPFGPVKVPGSGSAADPINPERLQKQAEYLATINLSKTPKWTFPLQTLPRPKGSATRVLITEYDLPRKTSQPHDVVKGPDGMFWYADFAKPFLGRLNPKTAEVKEFPVPEMRPGFPPGSLDVQFDKEGNVWLGRLMQGGVAKFDLKTEKFTSWSTPKEYNNDSVRNAMVAPENSDYDGKVWFDNAARNRVIHRVDLKTGEVETFDVFRETGKNASDGSRAHSIYDIGSDAQNNLYFTDMAGGNICKLDAKTGKVTLYPTPTKKSAPRRGHMDSKGRFWFGENTANRIGMFDPKTNQFREWIAPTPWSNPYDAVLDKNEEAWAGSTFNDRIQRLNTKTGKFTEYLLPRSTNIRRVFVDNSTTPVTFWVGNNHGAAIVQLQPTE